MGTFKNAFVAWIKK